MHKSNREKIAPASIWEQLTHVNLILLVFAFLPLVMMNTFAEDAPTGSSARLVAPGVISRGHDYCTSFSPDGKTLYFTRTDPASDRDSIMRSNLKDGSWGEPQVVDLGEGEHSNTDPMLSLDGNRLYFMSNRSPDGNGSKKDFDIWIAIRKGDRWESRRRLGPQVNTDANEGYACETRSENLYFFSMRDGGYGESDTYRTRLDGHRNASPAINLGPVLNTESWDGHAWVAPDESYMVFYSNKPGGYGKGDLYVSYRENGQWSAPENLGPEVNSPDYEITPIVDPSGKYLYFSRIHKDRGRDIYYIPIEKTLLRTRR